VREASDDRCPLCGEPLYGWATLPAEGSAASVGMRAGSEAGMRVLDRCEQCGAVVERGRGIDLEDELGAISEPGPEGTLSIACPNRASVQAALGGNGWAVLDRLPGRLGLTPTSLRLLASKNGYRLDEIAFPPLGPNQAWMWQTLLNALTFHNNFARDVRAGRLRPSKGRSRWTFAIDTLVTMLAAPLVGLISMPLEALATLARRGGEMRASAALARKRDTDRPPLAPPDRRPA
jgi:hypothetical protein